MTDKIETGLEGSLINQADLSDPTPEADTGAFNSPEMLKSKERQKQTRDALNTGDDDQEEEPDYTKSMPRPTKAMFPGVFGEAVEAATKNTECTPAGVGLGILVRLCAIIGRPPDPYNFEDTTSLTLNRPNAPFLQLGDGVFHCRLQALAIGRTAQGRKGLSDQFPKKLFAQIDRILCERHEWREEGKNKEDREKFARLQAHEGGLSSGEGIIYHLRDPKLQEVDGVWKWVGGQKDKRLLVIEEEFASILTVSERSGNILSTTLRKLRDGITLSPMAKSNTDTATDPHVCLVGHITPFELAKKLSENDIENGMVNRFFCVFTQRNKYASWPPKTPDKVVRKLADEFADIIEFAQTAGEITMNNETRLIWDKEYKRIERAIGAGEKMASLISRQSSFVVLFSIIFVLMDKQTVITPKHLKHALAWVAYSMQSMVYVFDGEKQTVDAEKQQTFSDRVLKAIKTINDGKGCTRTEIDNNEFGKRADKKKLTLALEQMQECIPPLIEMKKHKGRNNKPVRYYMSL